MIFVQNRVTSCDELKKKPFPVIIQLMDKTYETNKKAGFDYEILETFEAGLQLFGFEVKAIKAGRMNLEGAYVLVRGGEAYLINASISPYQPKNTPASYEPQRNRKLLLSRKELDYLSGKSQEKGLTLVPLRCYAKGNFLKLALAVARKKRKHDKRESIRAREEDRNIRRLTAHARD
jgi:SsrA-binding protein